MRAEMQAQILIYWDPGSNSSNIINTEIKAGVLLWQFNAAFEVCKITNLPFNKRNTINAAVKNRMSSELVTLRRRASIKGLFLVVVSTIQLLRAILMPPRLAPLCSCLLQNQPGAYAGRPLIKPLVPGALNLKTLAHNGRYCQLLFLLLILGDKKGVRI